MKRHPKTKEILAEMEKWAKKKKWPSEPSPWSLLMTNIQGSTPHHAKQDRDEPPNPAFWIADEVQAVGPGGDVIHFIPIGCESGATYTYCARPGVGKVVKHKIGNCPLAKEANK